VEQEYAGFGDNAHRYGQENWVEQVIAGVNDDVDWWPHGPSVRGEFLR
jgi:hypothetical protein